METQPLDHNQLNKMYSDSEEADAAVFAEMRSNVLLVAGEHYSHKSSKFLDRVRDDKSLNEDTKIRLTKNHVQRINGIYVNAIVSQSPGVSFEPNNKKEYQDQKAAAMHESVWRWLQKESGYQNKVLQWASDFCTLGEVAVKIYWDYSKGRFLGHEEKVKINEDTQEPEVDEQGNPIMEQGDTVWSGALVFERVFAFNLFRPKACQSMEDAPWLGIRKMIAIKDLREMFKDDKEKLDMIEPSTKTTYMVLNTNKGGYETAKDQVMLREIYYKPCPQYPQGYFFIWCDGGVLWEGELPFGRFPIIHAGFNEIQTSPRSRSIIKVVRPYQVELNRTASKIAEHQITLGDDKIIVSHGAKMSSAGVAPGVRSYGVSGPAPTVLPGRTGDQYLPYMESTIKEMYMAAMVAEVLEEKTQAQVDPYALLLQSAKWKQKFSLYSLKFEQFLVQVAELGMDLTRQYISDDELVQVVGKNEAVNITEFKNSKPMGYQIKIKPMSDDVESKMGKQLSFNHIIQFAGSSMDKQDLGKLFRQLPYLNEEEVMDDFTIDYDNATNEILALERGEQVQVNKYDDHAYMARRLSKRTRESDFKALPPPIQQAYAATIQQHEAMEVEKQIAVQRAQSGYIPTDGYLVGCDFYGPDPANPEKTKRVRVPYTSLQWLLEQMEAQGQSQESLEKMQGGLVTEMANQIANNSQKVNKPPGQ